MVSENSLRWVDAEGMICVKIPEACFNECSVWQENANVPVDPKIIAAADRWVKKIGFEVPREWGISFLLKSPEEMVDVSDEVIWREVLLEILFHLECYPQLRDDHIIKDEKVS